MSVSRAVEVERKYTVPDGAALPDLAGLADVVAADPQPAAALDAMYVDTADRTLLAARIAVRRRTGGHDAGWHVKLPAPVGRVELQAPIDDAAPEAFPSRFEQALRSRVRGRPLEPIARIRTERRAVVVRDAAGGAVEVVDDRVAASDVGAGVLRSWREWEAEQVGDPGASAALLERVDAALRAAGATPSDSPAKLAQALGLVGAAAAARPTTAGGVLGAAVARHTEQLHRGIQAVTLDGDPDGDVVHELRKTLRRLRSLLAMTPVAGASGARVKDLLGPLGTALGDARDPLVQAEVAADFLKGLDEDTPGLAAARRALIDEPRAGLAASTAAAAEFLGSAEALAAIGALEGYEPDGPDAGARPKRLVRLGRDSVARAVKRSHRGIGNGLDAMHRGRKAAKRARFVVEELVELGLVDRGSALAKQGKRAKRAQDALGEHRDLALFRDGLPVASERITAEGGNAFAVGRAAESAERFLVTLWREAERRIRRLR